MNTLKDNPMNHHCAVLRSDDNHQVDVEKSRFQSHVLQVLLGFLIVAINVIYSPVYAANSENAQSASEPEKQTPSKPDSFSEYALCLVFPGLFLRLGPLPWVQQGPLTL